MYLAFRTLVIAATFTLFVLSIGEFFSEKAEVLSDQTSIASIAKSRPTGKENSSSRRFLGIPRSDDLSNMINRKRIFHLNKPRRSIQKTTLEEVVHCLDSLSTNKKRQIHFAFVGDSTVRQHFFSFLRRIPDYDREIVNVMTKLSYYHFHEDRNVTSRLLDNLRISFYWRNLIKDDLIADFKRWASNKNKNQVPDFILLGVTAHHISKNNITNNLKMYETLLEKILMPLINQSLTVHPHQEIVWLLQSLTGADRFQRDVDAATILMYNKRIKHVFKDTRVVIWDSMYTIVGEYLRGCALVRYVRQDPARYTNCYDTIHPGMGALSMGTQLIINHICN